MQILLSSIKLIIIIIINNYNDNNDKIVIANTLIISNHNCTKCNKSHMLLWFVLSARMLSHFAMRCILLHAARSLAQPTAIRLSTE